MAMVENFYVRKSRNEDPQKSWTLLKRVFDGTDTDYTRVAWLSPEQAAALVGPHSGIGMMLGREAALLPKVPKAPMLISRVIGREPMTRAWSFSVAGIPGHRLDDEQVRDLDRHARVRFEPGQPDWVSREIENRIDTIEANNREIARLTARNAEILAGLPEGAVPDVGAWHVHATFPATGDAPEDAVAALIGAEAPPQGLRVTVLDGRGRMAAEFTGDDMNRIARRFRDIENDGLDV